MSTEEHIGPYQLFEELGRGGFAIVYRAIDTRNGDTVALKILNGDRFSPEDALQIRARFQREAEILLELAHPNIVRVLEYGEHDEWPYFVMQYIPAGSLRQQLNKALDWREAARLLLPVAQALAYAHQSGIVHRDVKPSNILLADDGRPMLADFGFVKATSAGSLTSLTNTGVIVGTPAYVAPEQIVQGGNTDHRSDIYSLGVVFYELITGRTPFDAESPLAVLMKHVTEPLPSARKFVRDLPPKVEQVLQKALAKKPDARYASMGEFAAALEKLSSAAAAPVRARRAVPYRWVGATVFGATLIGVMTWTVLAASRQLNALPPTLPPAATTSFIGNNAVNKVISGPDAGVTLTADGSAASGVASPEPVTEKTTSTSTAMTSLPTLAAIASPLPAADTPVPRLRASATALNATPMTTQTATPWTSTPTRTSNPGSSATYLASGDNNTSGAANQTPLAPTATRVSSTATQAPPTSTTTPTSFAVTDATSGATPTDTLNAPTSTRTPTLSAPTITITPTPTNTPVHTITPTATDTPILTITPTNSSVPCTAPQAEDLSFNPGSPAPVGTTVNVYAKAFSNSCFRAMRLKIDGSTVLESSDVVFNYSWNTSGYSPGDHRVRLEIAAQGDWSWSNPAFREAVYTLQAQPSISPPSLVSPQNGELLPPGASVTLVWTTANGATEYLVEIWGGQYGGSRATPCGWTSNTSCSIGTMQPGNVLWRVKARNGAEESAWSPEWNFTPQ